MKILIMNGPNMNILGKREPEIYGHKTLAQIEDDLKKLAAELGVEVEFFQSNHEGELVDVLQRAGETAQGVLLNAAAYTHTSVALRDAVLCCGLPVVEVHLSNPQARDDFRKVSYLAGACAGTVAGFGWHSYALGLLWFARYRGESTVSGRAFHHFSRAS